MLAFNAAGPEGLIDGKAPGKLPLLNAEQRAALQRIIEVGPNPAVDGVVRWRLINLAQWVYAEFGISVSKQTLSRMLRGLGYRKLSARPPVRRLKKLCCALGGDRAARCGGPADRGVFADEARIGQKNKITRPL